MKQVLCYLLAAVIFILPGCSSIIPTSKKTTTTTTVVHPNGDVVDTTVVEDDAVPDPISPEVARMVQACYESFGKDDIPDNVIAKLDAGGLRDVLMFKEFRMGLREANGFSPQAVCTTPKNIYDYAIAHDKVLYETISKGISDVTGLGPWAAGAWVANKAFDSTGDRVGGDKVDGDQLKAGGDQQATYSKTINEDNRRNDSTQVVVGDNSTTGEASPVIEGAPGAEPEMEEVIEGAAEPVSEVVE